MTRKDYELLARTFATTRPTIEQFTKTSPDGQNTMVNEMAWEIAYASWEATIVAVCNALEEDNPRFDRSRFQFAATSASRATVWLVDYRFAALTRDEALQAAGAAAIRDVPDATVQYIRDRQTPKGTWVVTLKRTRKAVEA